MARREKAKTSPELIDISSEVLGLFDEAELVAMARNLRAPAEEADAAYHRFRVAPTGIDDPEFLREKKEAWGELCRTSSALQTAENSWSERGRKYEVQQKAHQKVLAALGDLSLKGMDIEYSFGDYEHPLEISSLVLTDRESDCPLPFSFRQRRRHLHRPL